MLKEYFENVLCGPWKTAGKDVQYKIEGNVLYLAGSNSVYDWKTNFNFPAIPYKNMPIRWFAHRGYVKAWKEAREQILKEMLDNKVTTIVGYSFGGAIATLVHEDYVFNYGNNVRTYTFGAPRVLWMSHWINRLRFTTLIRVKVNGDVVTNVPFAWMGFHHIGTLVEYGPKKAPWWTHHMPREYKYYLDNEYTHE